MIMKIIFLKDVSLWTRTTYGYKNISLIQIFHFSLSDFEACWILASLLYDNIMDIIIYAIVYVFIFF